MNKTNNSSSLTACCTCWNANAQIQKGASQSKTRRKTKVRLTENVRMNNSKKVRMNNSNNRLTEPTIGIKAILIKVATSYGPRSPK